MKEWEELEKSVVTMLATDGAILTPGSGLTKKEEDVVGRTIICQCKQSGNKNISILRKDMDRLREAADLLNKTPIFVNKNEQDILITLIYDKKTQELIETLVVLNKIELYENIADTTVNEKSLLQLQGLIKKARSEFNKKTSENEARIKKIMERVDSKLTNMNQCNLFEGEHGG